MSNDQDIPEYVEKMASSWAERPLQGRMQDCRRMLNIHGLLTDAESARVKARIERAASKGKFRELKR